ncbi:MarR family transcriptional regulator [Pseudonocardia sp.]|uniref:MarR family transcriptional regulator n=1 Tax=Pseudonocardia sp. TaxID=60912 RepID=UPI003D13656F
MVLFHTHLAALLGLGPTDEKVLEIVARHGTSTPGEIGERTGLAPASVTGVLDRLEAKGYVRRTPSATDRRRVEVTHEPAHARAVEELFTGLLAGLAEVYARYSTDDLELVAGYVEATTEAQERAAHELGAAGRDVRQPGTPAPPDG